MRRRLPFLVPAFFTIHAAAAEPTPRCAPSREGEVACLAGKLCECRYDPGGSITGRPPGMRWNCGALRPACGAALEPPPETGQPQQPLPFLPVPPQPGWR